MQDCSKKCEMRWEGVSGELLPASFRCSAACIKANRPVDHHQARSTGRSQEGVFIFRALTWSAHLSSPSTSRWKINMSRGFSTQCSPSRLTHNSLHGQVEHIFWVKRAASEFDVCRERGKKKKKSFLCGTGMREPNQFSPSFYDICKTQNSERQEDSSLFSLQIEL